MIITNRSFRHKYQEIESYEAGIVLTGGEVKAIKDNRLRLDDAFVRILGNEVYLVNAEIPAYKFATGKTYDPKRSRKLLLHRKEITRIQTKLNGRDNLTIAPLSCYTMGSRVKCKIAIAKGKGEIARKKVQRKEDIALDQKRQAREYMKVDL